MPSPSWIYLLGTLAYLAIWALLYFLRPDLRRPMLMMSFIVGAVSVLSSYLWFTIDWWRPQTLTGTRVGIEDFLLGFSVGGIAVALYGAVFRQRFTRRSRHRHTAGFVLLWLLVLAMIAIGMWGYRLSSYQAFLLAAFLLAAALLAMRWDLRRQALISGALMIVVAMPFYWTILALRPGWVAETYVHESLSRIILAGLPLEEYVFFFFMGFTLALGYEYWQDAKYASLPS